MFLRNILLIVFSIICLDSYAQLQGSVTSKSIMYKKGEVFQGIQTTQISEPAWKGERIIHQLILWSASSLQNISYEITDLSGISGTISSNNISLKFIRYAKGDKTSELCGYYLDRDPALYDEIGDVLTNESITSIDPDDPIKLWLKIDIPLSTVAGEYSGAINIKINDVTQVAFKISLEVVDYSIPDVSQWDFHLDFWQYPTKVVEQHNLAHPGNPIEFWSDEHFALLSPLYQLLADLGQKVITAHIKDKALGCKSMIQWIKTDQNTWTYDFSAFDRYVELLMSLGITKQINCHSAIGWNSDEIPYYDQASATDQILSAPVGSTTFNTRWDHFLNRFKLHLDDKGWFNKTYIYMDEIRESDMVQVISMIKGNNAEWKIGLAAHSVFSASVEDDIDDLSMYITKLPSQTRTGRITTFYTACEPVHPNDFMIGDVRPVENIWMAWHSLNMGMDGFLRWAFDFWHTQNTYPFDMRYLKHNSGGAAFVYRSSNDIDMVFYNSLRAELIRDGAQDFEKVNILKQLFESSTDPYEVTALTYINAKIKQFTLSSGEVQSVAYLVESAQNLIEDIITKAPLDTVPESYCPMGGDGQANYYVGSLTTTGGQTNIDFFAGGYPFEGYEYHTRTNLTVLKQDDFTVNFINGSGYGGCSRVKVWIDWNIDGDFDDPGEEVYYDGVASTCTNSTSHAVNITVPDDAVAGQTIMRIKFRDAWLDAPLPCGVESHAGGVDFDILIEDQVTSLSPMKDDDLTDISIYPNPFNSHTYLHYELRKTDIVSIRVYSINGSFVKTLVNEKKTKGKHTVLFNASGLNPGLYYFTIQTNNQIVTRKMILIK